MRTIGLIGGLSWESSIEYYRLINQTVKERLGGLHSAKSLLYSFDFEEIEHLQHAGNWDEATRLMIEAAQNCERGGADFLLICSNTMHKMADRVQESIHIPLLHIADATAEKIVAAGIRKIGLLATAFTMEEDFYKGRLIQNFGLEVVIPNSEERQEVHRVIYQELCRGEVKPESKEYYVEVMRRLVGEGVEGIILGCTEIMLLVGQPDIDVPIFDTTTIHAIAAVEYALETARI